MTGERVVRAGVSCFVFNERGEFVLMKRQGSHGDGTWGLPGGHIDFGEDADGAVYREVEEELGLRPLRIVDLGWSEAVFPDDVKHYVTVVYAGWVDGVPELVVKEPEKCCEVRWVSLDDMPEPLFLPLHNFLSTRDGRERLENLIKVQRRRWQ